MAIALMIVQGLLGLLFVITGSFKFFQSKEKVIASGGAWAEDFPAGVLKLIAGAELISGLVLLISDITKRMQHLAFAGAVCIAVIMAGATFTHIRRKEIAHAGINTLFLAMALFVVARMLALI